MRTTLTDARRATFAGAIRTGATFSDAAAEWLRYIEQDRERKPSTVTGYRWIVDSLLLPTFGARPLEAITTEEVEAWLAVMRQASSSRVKALVLLKNGIYKRAAKVWGLAFNPAAGVERPPLRRTGDLEVYAPEEVWALVRAAASEQDAALFLTAASPGCGRGS